MTAAGSVAELSVAVDAGGTFTDIVLVDRASGQRWQAKVPSTPADRSQAFADGIAQILAQAGHVAAQVTHVLHGTTVATNAILEHKGTQAGLLTTAGFRHVLEIGRHDIPRHENLYSWVKPRRPIPPEHVLEARERLAADGSVVTPLEEADVREAAAEFRRLGVQAVAVCFLHAYADPRHEQRAGAILAEALPGIPITLSTEVLPVFREYERSMATALNAYVMPAVATYVRRVEQRLRDGGIAAPLLLMKSSGGVIRGEGAARQPVQTALSGPAAGVVGARAVGLRAGHPRLITLDVGGTSADISLIDGEPRLTSEGRVGDWPLTLPMIDIHTIGAGGGSIARVSPEGALLVGPESAGADPGPVAYGRGGEAPTLTDANLVLGRLPPSLLDGGIRLDVAAAARAIEAQIAKPLGLSLQDAARGIVAVADNAMAGAIRVVSVQRGHDPQDFSLLPFGGAGPLQAGAIARLLGMKRILVPARPGVLSAEGLLAAPLRNEFARTVMLRAPLTDVAPLANAFGALDAEAAAWLVAESVPEAAREIRWRAGMRYMHQGFELYVDWPGRSADAASLAEAVERFHAQHEQLYTFAQRDTPVEVVTLEVTALGRLPGPAAEAAPPAGETTPAGDALVHLEDGPARVPVWRRDALGAGAVLRGPGIVVQMDATTWLHPGDVATLDAFGNLVVEVG
ncbi:hydantoinase/oxoprolinase family protein [Roseomonas frigidaquae]|uniref:Hydantoinase/oxoprolinase family protein n=1 Tax=Falsiroseomonas frigidaquae TaxID=487318 RepID=A0ABX1EUU7_9PROT|nr:hydantoinase/oxoprolinase family protein [Falsiroseomonas frigidaquae]NKE44108.1 hydantoinase/oxoprolinase family protein [Falsiroseomonas frigidaquae]